MANPLPCDVCGSTERVRRDAALGVRLCSACAYDAATSPRDQAAKTFARDTQVLHALARMAGWQTP